MGKGGVGRGGEIYFLVFLLLSCLGVGPVLLLLKDNFSRWLSSLPSVLSLEGKMLFELSLSKEIHVFSERINEDWRTVKLC